MAHGRRGSPTPSLGIAMVVSASVAVWLAGCALFPTATPTRAPPTPTPVPSPTVVPTLPTAVSTPIDPSAPVTLTLWLPPEMAVDGESAAQVIAELNQTFMVANPRVRIEVVPKAAYGPGGLVDMLLATRPVVPARLPDIVVFDTSELHKLASKDILVPVEELFPQALWDDLFPFAVEAVTVDESMMGVPLGTDIIFLAYNSAMVEGPPRTWKEMVAANATYLFPASKGDGSAADALLLLYFAEGGSLQGWERPELNPTLAASILRDYRAALESGAVPEMVRTMSTFEDCWALYLAGEAGMSLASSWQYQRDRATLRRTRYAQVPTIDGKPFTLARSWAWGILTEDPLRQKLASRYIATATGPGYLSLWSSASFHLPVRRSILSLAIEDEDYRAFLDEQLQNAGPYPNVRGYSLIQDAVVRAIEDVLGGVTTPERAAVTAAAMILRLR